jgi:hypothetical protein
MSGYNFCNVHPGHRSIAVTQAYIHVNDEMKRQAVELV